MTDLLACWLAFPALLGLIAQGAGTLIERSAGLRLSAGARIPCGVALMIALLDLLTSSSSTAPAAVPVLLALAAIGLALSRPWTWRLPEAGLIAGLIVFALFALPIVASGAVTWAGYLKLDDTASWLAVVNWALSHGHSLAGLPPSSYLVTLRAYLLGGYPIGAFLPLGLGHALLGQDNAWLVDPWMAFLAGTLALALYRMAKLTLGERAPAWRAVLIAALAAQPALLYGYYLWGGIKEVTAAALIASFAALAPLALRDGPGLRKLIPAAVVLWAMVAALTPGGLVYVGPGLLLALVLWGSIAWRRDTRAAATPRVSATAPGRRLYRARPRVDARRGWAPGLMLLAAIGLFGYLALRREGFVGHAQAALTSEAELGNLIRPLDLLQIAGIWPNGDFRFAAHAPALTYGLIALVALCALAGLARAVRAARRELVLYVFCAFWGALLVYALGSPWVAAKALASASPALPFAALTALLSPREQTGRAAPRAWRAARAIAATGVAAGIVWSNLLAYHEVSLAPSAQFQELAEIGGRIAGQGPTLMTEYQPYGSDDFLREAAPELISGLHARDDRLLSGALPKPGLSTDIDQIRVHDVLLYRTLVLQRSPVASRPPAPYRLLYADRFWEVWQRPAVWSANILWHLALGSASQPGGVPDCATLRRLAARPGVRRVLAEPLEHPLLFQLAESAHPGAWSMTGPWLSPTGSGSARLTVRVTRAGRYSAWIGGSTRGVLSLYVDGRKVGEAANELEESAQYMPFGQIHLAPGVHSVELRYGVGDWAPGEGGAPEPVGPLVLRRELGGRGAAVSRAALISLPANRASALCGQTLDWVEGIS